MNDNERRLELSHLKNIEDEIRSQLASESSNHITTQAELNASLTDYWENSTTDFWEEAQFIETISRQRSIAIASYRRYLQLKKLLDSPYFGRIDFMEQSPLPASEAKPIYIGVATLTQTATKAILIYDWRSPIAGMFYDFERGEASYHSPSGPISGLITLKRQYKINHGRMEFMFDSDLKIDDEILQEILSRSVDSKMRTIVTSIQREQNKAIRDENHRVLIVQGPAGSGKTSIAMHRIAYLLYRDRHKITANNILIFSPNRIFSDYISNVLPELGEENVRQTTFQDYLVRALAYLPYDIEDRDTQLEYLYHKNSEPEYTVRTASIHYKSSAEFNAVIENYLQKIQDQIQNYPAITFQGETIFTQAEWSELFGKTLSYLPISRRLAQLKKMIQIRLRPIIHRLRDEEAERIANTGDEVNERVIKALARIAVKEKMAPFIEQITERTTVDPLTLYRRLFEDSYLFQSLAGESKVPSEWPEICRLTLTSLEKGQILYEDSLPLVYFQGCLNGFQTGNSIRHLVIDEAQDYTLLQYQILKRLFPKSSWTILGDPAQSIHSYLQTADFKSAAAILSEDAPQEDGRAVIIRLTRSYRTTSEIQNFARQLLLHPEEADQIQRPGPLPYLREILPEEKPGDIALHTIKMLQDEGRRSIAVICKTVTEARNVYAELKDSVAISLITPESIEFKRGIVVVPAYLAKGLEFDGVLIYNANADAYATDSERNILYTVCTRALHRLVLHYSGELSPIIRGVDPHSYTRVFTN